MGLFDDRLRTLYGIRLYEQLLLRCLDGAPIEQQDERALADQRNHIIHHVMSLEPPTSLLHRGDRLHECCRLSLILYSMGVVFPMTLHAAPWDNLISRLCLLLNQDGCELIKDARNSYSSALSIVAWIATVGGIAAYQTAFRSDFVSLLRFSVAAGNLGTDFESFKACMGFLEVYIGQECQVGTIRYPVEALQLTIYFLRVSETELEAQAHVGGRDAEDTIRVTSAHIESS